MVLYGTYLTFAVEQIFLKENSSFSAKELAALIAADADLKLIRRVRRALKELEDMGILQAELERVPGTSHLSTIKYSKKHEAGPQFS